MTREQFTSLPESVRSGLIYDLAASKLAPMPVPATPGPASTAAPAPTQSGSAGSAGSARAPKYDGRILRKGGFVFMSEMLISDLEWWITKKRESVAGGGQYAEKDRKVVAELERFILWRTACPSDRWEGIRGETRVTAALPSRDPPFHQWGPPARSAPTVPARGDLGTAEDQIPF